MVLYLQRLVFRYYNINLFVFGVYVHNNNTKFVVSLFSFPLFPFFLILLFYCFCLPLNSTIISFCSVCVTLYVLIDDLYVSLYVSLITSLITKY